MSAIRALALAVAIEPPCVEARREMLDSDRSPTAITVSKIISDSVTTNANPRGIGFLDFFICYQLHSISIKG
jgi:hypothetical protein